MEKVVLRRFQELFYTAMRVKPMRTMVIVLWFVRNALEIVTDKLMPLRSWRLGIPALETNQSSLLDIFCKRIVRLIILDGRKVKAKKSI